jgi:uncharacterized protein YlbG (UPF0298 family)
MSNDFTNEDFNSMLKEMEDEKNSGTFQSPYWKPANEGTYQLRIITPLKQFGEKLFYEKHKMHYIGNKAFYCLNQTLKDKNGNIHEAEACPICAKSKQLYNSSTKGTEEWKIAGDLRAKDRFVSRVIVRGKKTKEGEDDETKPEFWEFGTKIHGYFFDQIKLGEAGNFLSLKDGRDYNLVKKGTGRNTDYSGSCLSMKQSAIFTDTEKLKKLLEHLPQMEYSQLVEFSTAEDMKSAMNEALSEEAAAENPAPAPVSDIDVYSQPAASVAPQTEEAPKTENIDDLLKMI